MTVPNFLPKEERKMGYITYLLSFLELILLIKRKIVVRYGIKDIGSPFL